jgi:hypothetical protein
VSDDPSVTAPLYAIGRLLLTSSLRDDRCLDHPRHGVGDRRAGLGKPLAVLLGRRAWWLPRPMERLVPHVSIEGEDFFAKRDAR